MPKTQDLGGWRVTTSADAFKPTPVKIWVGFGAMCVGMFMAILDVQIVVTSLPNIQAALNIPPDQMSWIQTAYLIAEVIAIPLTGVLIRTLGMRRLFVTAISIFTLASLGCAASQSFGHLVALRVVQGLAGGVLIPAVFAAVFLMFPLRHQGLATTIAGVLAVLAPTVGPIAGGYLTSTFSWHWLFLINILPGLLAGAICLLALPRTSAVWGGFRQFDLLALVGLALALASFEIALKEAPDRGWLDPRVIGFLAISLMAGVAFVRRTLSQPAPIVDLTTFTNPNFAVGCVLSFVLGIGLFGSVYLMPVFLAFVRGHTAFEIGTIMLVTGAAQLLVAPFAVALEPRVDARLLTASGFLVFAIGLGLSAFQTPDTDAAQMVWPQLTRGVAIMFCLLPPTRLALGHIELSRVPDASGVFNLMRNLGGAIGLALIDTILFGRVPEIAAGLIQRLSEGDAATAAFIGLPPAQLALMPAGPIDPASLSLVQPLIEKAALTMAINDAWAMIALMTLSAMLLVPFVKAPPKAHRNQPEAGVGA